MSKFIALVKLNLKGMLATMSMGRSKDKTKSATGIGALVLMIALSLYISGIYSFMLGGLLAPAGLIQLMPVMMAVISCLLSLMLTVFAASGMVFGGKDMDLMLSLPLSPFSVMLSKIMALYLENLVFSVFMMLPACVAYLVFGGAGGILFIVRLIIVAVFLPILPTFFSMLIGFVIAWVSGHLKRSALIMNFVYIVFFVGVMYFSFKISSLTQVLLSSADSINNAFSSWLLPFGLMRDGMYGNLLSLLGFIAITVIPFLLVVYLFSKGYKKLLTGLSSHSMSSNYKMSSLKTNGQFGSLAKKEFGRFFGTPIYLFNTGIGAVLAIAGSIYACFMKDTIMEYLPLFGDIPLLPLIGAVLGFLCITICTSCVSISLEGKTLWILKEAPIPTKSLLLSKFLVNAILIWGTGIICIPMLTFAFELAVLDVIALAFLILAFGVLIPVLGLIVNLIFPKMDAPNDALVVKQSMSVIMDLLANFLILGIGVGLFFLYHLFLGYAASLILVSVVFLALGYGLWIYLMKTGEKKILAL